MEEAKFYSVTENGEELEMLKSLLDAAALWEVSTTRRAVFELAPHHDNAENGIASWTRVREVPPQELTELMRHSRE